MTGGAAWKGLLVLLVEPLGSFYSPQFYLALVSQHQFGNKTVMELSLLLQVILVAFGIGSFLGYRYVLNHVTSIFPRCICEFLLFFPSVDIIKKKRN